MKILYTFLVILFFTLASTLILTAQTEIKGSGTTAATNTLVTKNATPTTTMVVRDDGNVGINESNPTQKLEVKGIVYSSSGGFKFPDASTQTKAALFFQQVFTVAQSGGDFTTINNALTACTSPSKTNAYLIRVMPGVYQESVNMQMYIHFKGAGKYTTIITGTVTGADSSTVEGFKILQGVMCNATSPTIRENIITNLGDSGDGITVTNQGKPWIIENEIMDCNGWGIFAQNAWSDPWIIANKILRNKSGGILCVESSPTISNNQIQDNKHYGIELLGNEWPSEPTISDNVISYTDYTGGGIGIHMQGLAEPRIIGNDIYKNECGIWIDHSTQPSIIGNNINYNFEAGIRCFSNGSSKPVVIKSNHIHSNAGFGSSQPAGIWLSESSAIITHNNIHHNDRQTPSTLPDIDYNLCIMSLPMISLNVYDRIVRSGGGLIAGGSYNVNTAGGPIGP